MRRDEGREVLGNPLRRPGVIGGDAPANVLGVERRIGECGPELGLGELAERLAKPSHVLVGMLVDVEHLPDVHARSGDHGPPAGRPVHEGDAGTPAHGDALVEELGGHCGKIATDGLGGLCNGLD